MTPQRNCITPTKTRHKTPLKSPRSVIKGDKLGEKKSQTQITKYFSITPVKSEVTERNEENIITTNSCRRNLMMPSSRVIVPNEPIVISDDDCGVEHYHSKTRSVMNRPKKSHLSLSRKSYKTKPSGASTPSVTVKSEITEHIGNAFLDSENDPPSSPRKKFKKQSVDSPTAGSCLTSSSNISKNPIKILNVKESQSLLTQIKKSPDSVRATCSRSIDFTVTSSLENSDSFGSLVENVIAEFSAVNDSPITGKLAGSVVDDVGNGIRVKTERDVISNVDTDGCSPMEVEMSSPTKTNIVNHVSAMDTSELFLNSPTKLLDHNNSEFSTPKKKTPATDPKTSTPSGHINKSPNKSPRKRSPKKSPMKLDREAMSGDVALEHCILECKRYAQFALELNATNKKVANDLLSLPFPEKKLLHKLLLRKWSWIRDIDMKYDAFVHDKTKSLDILLNKGFLDTMSSSHGLEVILEQLKRPELDKLCKSYKVEGAGAKREELINRLCKFANRQGGLGFSKKNLKSVMTETAIELVGKCVKIREDARIILHKIFEASMSPLYLEGQFYTFQHRLGALERLMNDVRFQGKRLIPFSLSDFQLFLSPAQFDEFITSVILKFDMLTAKDEKNNQKGMELARDAMTSLLIYLNSPQVTEFLDKTPRHIWRYTAGSNYTSALDVGIDFFKRSKKYAEALVTIGVLLGQEKFKKHCRGRWYAEKVMIMDKQCKESASEIYPVLISGLKEDLTPIGRLELSKKAEGIMNKKKNGLTNDQKIEIRRLMRTPKLKHTMKEIRCNEAPNVSNGTRQTFVEFSASGERTYLNVEEVARNSYMSEFPEGLHDEGSFLKNIILASFWPVIYGDRENAFVSRYQNAPLDWGSQAFYRNRQREIQDHMSRFREGGVDCVMEQIVDVITEYANYHSLINWFYVSSDMVLSIKNILTCLTIEKFLMLSNYLLESFRERRSGWPDLTLWNTVTGKFKLVEVKSPNDELSFKQIVWLEKFAEMGIDAEECRVNPSNKGKKQKLQRPPDSDASQEV